MLSANEELATLNEELRFRIAELGRLNDDLSNLIQGVGLPIVMVDRELRIRRFTSPAERLLNLIGHRHRPAARRHPPQHRRPRPGRTGRHGRSIRSRPRNRRPTTARGTGTRCGSGPISPPRTGSTAPPSPSLDIDALKRSYMQLKDARDYADAIVQTVWEPLVVLDADLCIRRANQAFYQTFGVSEPRGGGPPPRPGARRAVGRSGAASLDCSGTSLTRNSRLENVQIDVEPGLGRAGRSSSTPTASTGRACVPRGSSWRWRTSPTASARPRDRRLLAASRPPGPRPSRPTAARTSSWPCWPTSCGTRWPRSSIRC